MKNVKFFLLSSAFALLLSSCGMLSKNKQGCGSNGKNVGAEKLLDGSAPKKSPKFKA
jgi:hypothetical protein